MQPSSSRSRLSAGATVVIAFLVALTLAGCGQSGSSKAPVAKGAAHVAVTLTNTGGEDTCTLDHDSATAGPVTFTLTNTSSTGITEVELQSEGRIIGEKENLAPGLGPVSFTVTLPSGTYQLYCPGAAKDTHTFTVTGAGAAASGGSVQTLLKTGTTGYGKYVDGVVADMVTAVDNLKSAVDSGNLEQAKGAYAQARPFYERIESDVDGFVLPGFSATDNAGNLDYLIDMRQSNLDDAVGWHGFHAVERDLYQGGAITDSTKTLAAELQSNVTGLSSRASKITYKPEDLANGSASLLEEVQSEKIKGEEEAFSHLDLIDFAANVEGAQQAFAFLQPGLKKIDPDVTKQVTTQFDRVLAMLSKYKDASAAGGYVTYTAQLRASDASKLSQAVQALQDPLSKIAEKVATAR